MQYQSSDKAAARIGIIGGGVGGATIALRLSEQGADVTLFEKESSLVNGPPMCHLHAGGNLYREISDEQCIDLLKQSISTARLYRDAIDYRPTVIAVPKQDNGQPEDVIARLKTLQSEYAKLIAKDPQNQVLGPAEQYFSLFEREQLEKLAHLTTPNQPQSADEWMIAFAKNVDLNQLKFPLVLVQEYGISVFRLAAITSLSLEKSENCELLTNTQVTSVSRKAGTQNLAGLNLDSKNSQTKTWLIEASHQGERQTYEVDYLINACGFQTGIIDDMVGLRPKRVVEFKAAYISHWPSDYHNWPEIIFHGERGTPNGMTQLTPYPNGYFQIHAMTPDVTLFEDGLVSAKADSAQPVLPKKFLTKVNAQWDPEAIVQRTNKAIEKVKGFIPTFDNATVGGPPLFGAQQIPGDDASLRVADVAFQDESYARCEIVKASSALPAANTIIKKLVEQSMLVKRNTLDILASVTNSLSELEISQRAEQLAIERDFPKDMAGRTNPDF